MEEVLIAPALCLWVFQTYCWWRIMKKAGFGNWGLLAFILPLPLILLVVLAFRKWHIPEVKQ